jgi:hypothetical protein
VRIVHRAFRPLIISGVLLLPAAARAQSFESGAIAGAVKDTSGALVPGVTVEAASPALIERVRSATSDAQGQYKILDLRPGIYSVSFRLEGFSTVKRSDLSVAAGTTLPVNVEMHLGSVQETITVSAATPVVDVQNVRSQNVLSRDTLDAIPNAKNFQSLASLTVGAIVPFQGGDVGGNQGETVYCCQIHGGAVDGITTIDGLKTSSTYSTASAHRNNFNQMMIQELVMETGGASAESESGGLNVHVVQKDGGNEFHGAIAGEYSGSALQSDNLTPELKARGVTRTNSVGHIYDTGIGIGGPIARDKLWFYAAARGWGNKEFLGGLYFNRTQNTLFYTPDPARPAFHDNYVRDGSGRLTWQATAKQKVSLAVSDQDYCQCYSFINGLSSPEATWDFHVRPNTNYALSWDYPVTSKLLLQAATSVRHDRQWNGVPAATGNAHSVLELTTGLMYGSTFTGYGTEIDYGDVGDQTAVQTRASASYDTGSHAFKVGMQSMTGGAGRDHMQPLYDTQYFFYNQVPVALAEYAAPFHASVRMKLDLGLYAQDQWTIKRLTLNAGLRFDYLNDYSPAQTYPATAFTPAFDFPAMSDIPNWKDLSPRVGAAFDVFGDGKTAIKVAVGRYPILETTNLAQLNSPASAFASTTTRTWSPPASAIAALNATGQIMPDCNLANPAANGDCGPVANSAFGTSVVTTHYSPSVMQGWNVRPSTWQASLVLQQQLKPGIGVWAGYYRTWYTNILATDNQALQPSDVTPYCVTAPASSQLPGGGGYPVCGLYDVSPAKFGAINNVVVDSSTLRGGPWRQVYDGIEVGSNARFRSGGMLTGGVSTGRTAFNQCASRLVPTQFCDFTMPLAAQTQIKLTASYPLRWGFEVAGTYISLPGVTAANPAGTVASSVTMAVANAQIAPVLGRNLAACGAATAATCTATANVVLVAPYEASTFENRHNQVDARLSRVFAVGNIRIQPRIDVYNLFNSATVLGVVSQFGPAYRFPYQVYDGRLVKFGAEVRF